MATPADPDATGPAPLYFLRQRNGAPGGQHLTADEAAMVARRPGTIGDYRSPVGMTWAEPDPAGPGGFSYFTLTPVYAKP